MSGDDVTPAQPGTPASEEPIDGDARPSLERGEPASIWDAAGTPAPEAAGTPTAAAIPSGPVEPDTIPAGSDPTCPYLGMVGDRDAHHTFPSRTHLCYAGEAAHVGLGFQLDFCLGGRYPDCARFQRAESGQVAQSVPVTAAPVAFASGPKEKIRLRTGQSGGGSSRLVTAMLGLALVGAVLAFGLASGIIAIPGGGPAASTGTPTAPPTGQPSELPTDSPSPSTLETATPTAPPTASPSTAPTASPSGSPGQVTHVVQPGETLTSIAALYGVTVEAIIAANGITNPDVILAGTVLIIPVDASGSPLPTVDPTPGPTASDGTTTYVVKAGDTLSAIAIRFGVTVQAIQAANSIDNPNEIFVGQVLIIPPPP